MTDRPDSPGPDLADQPLDSVDARLLGEVADLYDSVDPVPDDLVERVKFLLALDEVFDEVAQITRMSTDAAGVRTALTDADQASTLTFAAERLTAMVTVTRIAAGRVRVDGWVSPGGERRVNIRMQGQSVEVQTDVSGRFAAEDLREGFVQLVFHALESEEAVNPVVTPLFKL